MIILEVLSWAGGRKITYKSNWLILNAFCSVPVTTPLGRHSIRVSAPFRQFRRLRKLDSKHPTKMSISPRSANGDETLAVKPRERKAYRRNLQVHIEARTSFYGPCCRYWMIVSRFHTRRKDHFISRRPR